MLLLAIMVVFSLTLDFLHFFAPLLLLLVFVHALPLNILPSVNNVTIHSQHGVMFVTTVLFLL